MKNHPVNVEAMLSEIGIKLEKKYLSNNVSGMIKKGDDGQYTIVVNSNHPITRQRFTIAHELGHFIYHKDKMNSGTDDNIMYRSDNHTDIGKAEETEANVFASKVLMPVELIKSLQEKYPNKPALADALQVSKKALGIRMKNMK